MNIYDFLALTDEQQWDVIWDKSIFLTNYESIDCKFQLRALEKLFIEIELDLQTEAILAKNVFIQGPRLDKYADELGYSNWKKNENP